MKKKFLIAISLIILNIVLIGVITMRVGRHNNASLEGEEVFTCASTGSQISTDTARKCWGDHIKKVGAEQATRDFETWNKQFDPNKQHSYAHVFGGVLYPETGSKGLKFCSPNFAYGCFHEFIGRAIKAEGLAVTHELNEGCRKDLGDLALGCQHGIGHGILSALGYEEKDMYKALVACRDLPYNDPIGGCYGGVFMEYNMRTVLSTDGGTLRPMMSGKEDECPTLEKAYIASCYYWQPQWWSQSLRESGVDEHEVFAKVGAWCRSSALSGREQCFRGIGNIDPAVTMYDVDKSIELCRYVAAGEHLSFKYCIEDVANSFNAIPEVRMKTPKICNALNGAEVKECEERIHMDPKLIAE